MFGVRFDWCGYFREFCRLHGDPVEHEGRLLFRDGWTYSGTDHAGPEWPPPEEPEELRRLRFAYWRLYKELAMEQLRYWERITGELRQLQSARSAPLMRRVPSAEEGQAWGVEKLDLSELHERRQWLEQAAALAEAEIAALESGV